MITNKDLVYANLIHYFKAVCEIEIRKRKLEELEQKLGVHSPNLDGLRGYTKPRDSKLADYSNEIIKIQDELKGWETQRQLYYSVLHLNELDEQDLKFLSFRYKDKMTYDEIANKMFYNSKQYANKKDNTLLEKLGKLL